MDISGLSGITTISAGYGLPLHFALQLLEPALLAVRLAFLEALSVLRHLPIFIGACNDWRLQQGRFRQSLEITAL